MIKRFFIVINLIFISLSVNAQDILFPPIVIGVDLNEYRNTSLFHSWPLLVTAKLFNENLFQENVPVKLSSNWKDAFHFIIKNSNGDIVSWPFHLVASPGENITLDSTTIAELAFWLDGEETNQIPAGDYKLIAVLDSTAYPELGSNFSSVRTDTHKIKILDEPASLSIEQKAEKDMLFANLNLLKGDDEKALEYLNNILGYNPNDLRAILLTGKLLEDQGDYGSAMFAYSKAVDIFLEANPDPAEPPFELLQAQNDLAYKLDNSQAFNITLSEKDTLHPFYGLGGSSCYYVDNIAVRELQLKRGNTYTFYMKNIPSGNAFYFSKNIKGGGLDPYTEGVNGAPADSNEIVTFSVGVSAPDTLYYQSYSNEFAGWRINITDSSGITSIKENPNMPQGYYISLAYPNPFNPQTNIKIIVNKHQHIVIKVFNIVGEQLQILFDGNVSTNETHNFEFNGGNLASGIYLIRIEGAGFTESRKVILLK
jgi:tetratricopeptide (TPR) repeat protein